eukprot:935058-Prymnesium_polylepis.2
MSSPTAVEAELRSAMAPEKAKRGLGKRRAAFESEYHTSTELTEKEKEILSLTGSPHYISPMEAKAMGLATPDVLM